MLASTLVLVALSSRPAAAAEAAPAVAEGEAVDPLRFRRMTRLGWTGVGFAVAGPLLIPGSVAISCGISPGHGCGHVSILAAPPALVMVALAPPFALIGSRGAAMAIGRPPHLANAGAGVLAAGAVALTVAVAYPDAAWPIGAGVYVGAMALATAQLVDSGVHRNGPRVAVVPWGTRGATGAALVFGL